LCSSAPDVIVAAVFLSFLSFLLFDIYKSF
jgi:hypothetical protein